MGAKGNDVLGTPGNRLKYALGEGAKTAETLDISAVGLGQMNPQHCARRQGEEAGLSGDPLGEALTIQQVAELLGCSVWTVRKQCLRRGLPCFRIGGTGKLVFYRAQVTRWILDQQEMQGGRR
jgi:excisionase family DNA binding protein